MIDIEHLERLCAGMLMLITAGCAVLLVYSVYVEIDAPLWVVGAHVAAIAGFLALSYGVGYVYYERRGAIKRWLTQ